MNGTLLALGTVAAVVAAAGVAHQRGMRGSRAHPSRATLLSTPIRSEAEARAFIRAMVVSGFAYHLDDAPEDILRHRSGRRLFSKAEVPLMRERADELFRHLNHDPHAEMLDALALNEGTEGSRSMPRSTARTSEWDVLYKDGLLVWRVHATSAKAAVAKVRGQLIAMGRNPAGLKLEAIRVPLDELSLKLF